MVKQLNQKYREYKPLLGELRERASPIITGFCRTNTYPFIDRIKEESSVSEKIETGRYRSWSELDDLYACTVVVPDLRHEEKAIEFLEIKFDIKEIRKRQSTIKSPDTFRFDSTRVICNLRPSLVLEPQPEINVYSIPFEVQIHSAFEYAWNISSHSLIYKSDIVSWKRKRLGSQLKAIVEQVDSLLLSFDETSAKLFESPWPELEKEQKIAESLGKWRAAGLIPEYVLPRDTSRFATNFRVMLASSQKNCDLLTALDTIEDEIKSLGYAGIPRSLSFLQFSCATLIAKDLLGPLFKKYVCHITQEMIDMYPEVANIKARFKYN